MMQSTEDELDRKFGSDPLVLLPFSNFDSFDRHRHSGDSAFLASFPVDKAMVRDQEDYTIDFYCAVCRKPRDMHVSKALGFAYEGVKMPLWRETIVCSRCGLNNRMRALLHIMSDELHIPRRARVYFTEQITPTFAAAKRRWPKAVGSEFLRDGTLPGRRNGRGVRCEDMTRLSFPDGSFDALATMDVIEHVPDYKGALQEAFRVLRPGGHLILSAPFDLDAEESTVRARVGSDGGVVHLLEPEYHGDPLDPDGLLCFTTFGWDFLRTLREVGFQDPTLNFYWSDQAGYLGVQYVILAVKPAGPPPPVRMPWFALRRD